MSGVNSGDLPVVNETIGVTEKATEFTPLFTLSSATSSSTTNKNPLPNSVSNVHSHHRPYTYSSISANDVDGRISSSGNPYWAYLQDLYNRSYQYANENRALVLAAAVLIVSTVIERVSFKIMIDRMLPYKFMLVEIIFFLSCFVFAAVAAYKQLFTSEITPAMHRFPHSKILVIAVMDSIQFLGLVFSAAEVSPTMTVILMHSSTLFIVLGSKLAFPQRHYGTLHAYGVMLISTAIVISILKIIWNDFIVPGSGFIVTWDSMIYLAASSLQGLSTFYKEKALVDWSQPISIYLLSSWLFFYQFWVTIFLSFLHYTVSGTFHGVNSLFNILLIVPSFDYLRFNGSGDVLVTLQDLLSRLALLSR